MTENRAQRRRGPIGWISDRSRRFWAYATIGFLLGAPILYVLSFGAVCWAISQKMGGTLQQNSKIVSQVYWPLGKAAVDKTSTVGRVLRWYVRACTPDGRYVMVPTSSDGGMTVIFKQDAPPRRKPASSVTHLDNWPH